ncbi:hypothetical protein CPC08DRAFT_521918 [Agrocybe pediades]|nr:hypothetical protein CPC08DRAFT_521918 [Agrocybe pediades]
MLRPTAHKSRDSLLNTFYISPFRRWPTAQPPSGFSHRRRMCSYALSVLHLSGARSGLPVLPLHYWRRRRRACSFFIRPLFNEENKASRPNLLSSLRRIVDLLGSRFMSTERFSPKTPTARLRRSAQFEYMHPDVLSPGVSARCSIATATDYRARVNNGNRMQCEAII